MTAKYFALFLQCILTYMNKKDTKLAYLSESSILKNSL